MFGITRAQVAHSLMALGAAAGVFVGLAASITPNPWVDAGCYAVLAFLTAMGVGVAKRMPADPPVRVKRMPDAPAPPTAL